MPDADQSTRVSWLLDDLCVKLGCCSAAREQARFEGLVDSGPEVFADAVLVAEGLNPDTDKQSRREVLEFVAARFARWNPAGAA